MWGLRHPCLCNWILRKGNGLCRRRILQPKLRCYLEWLPACHYYGQCGVRFRNNHRLERLQCEGERGFLFLPFPCLALPYISWPKFMMGYSYGTRLLHYTGNRNPLAESFEESTACEIGDFFCTMKTLRSIFKTGCQIRVVQSRQPLAPSSHISLKAGGLDLMIFIFWVAIIMSSYSIDSSNFIHNCDLIAQDELENLPEILGRISRSEIEQMQTALSKVWRRFAYSSDYTSRKASHILTLCSIRLWQTITFHCHLCRLCDCLVMRFNCLTHVFRSVQDIQPSADILGSLHVTIVLW